ncbi:PEF-CTERM sorting domain-containing protein [Methanolobus vulcani]|uniref:PEF-CTERM sorting domain-containing protein n=1 Tax=Methanolobus vulcani TaxID=38026 RepID=UPI0012B69432|nr:PEF-CTERM sorting domain-containing protein [Methanolobus vulcani]
MKIDAMRLTLTIAVLLIVGIVYSLAVDTDGEIPEFPTIALPMITIVGLTLFFKRRG